MNPVATDPDVVQFLADEIRAQLTAIDDPSFVVSQGWISDTEWTPPAANPNQAPPRWQVIVRDDGIADGDLIVGECSLGISTLAGSKQLPAPAKRLAVLVKRIVKATPRAEAGNPISAVTSFLGPYSVEEPSTYARCYMAASLSIVGLP